MKTCSCTFVINDKRTSTAFFLLKLCYLKNIAADAETNWKEAQKAEEKRPRKVKIEKRDYWGLQMNIGLFRKGGEWKRRLKKEGEEMDRYSLLFPDSSWQHTTHSVGTQKTCD